MFSKHWNFFGAGRNGRLRGNEGIRPKHETNSNFEFQILTMVSSFKFEFMKSIRILGVDTSLRSTGVAVLEVNGQQMRTLTYGNIRNHPNLKHSECLAAIHREIEKLIEEFSPDEVAIEGAFFAKNAKTAMILGQVRGVVLALSALRNLPIFEYSPRSVKQAVVGVGSAQKAQVGAMVARLLGLAEPPQEDAADALAIAICHAHQRGVPETLRSKPV